MNSQEIKEALTKLNFFHPAFNGGLWRLRGFGCELDERHLTGLSIEEIFWAIHKTTEEQTKESLIELIKKY